MNTRLPLTILRLLQLAFTAIILGLCGALLQQQVAGGTPTRLNYAMFAAALAGLSLLYLLPSVFIAAIHNPVAALVLDILNFLFLLCAGIALAASLGGRSCNDARFRDANGIINGGSPVANRVQRCHEAHALTAFEWFAAFTFLASALIVWVSSCPFLPGKRKGKEKNVC